jgi:membrane protein implicated in regulation of membrane protease activity
METIFLACFVFGLLFTLASVALGFVGGVGGHAAHVGHVHVGHAHPTHDAGHDTNSLPLLNASSAIGGLTWFGAAGYVLTRMSDWALPVAIIAALVVGAIGWYVVARFLGLILKGEVEMNPDDYRLEGTVGQVSVGIPAGGTGEILFEKGGSRRGEAARALAGQAIPRGTEVVITTYADGFATVQPWTEFIAERDRAVRVAATPIERVEKREA